MTLVECKLQTGRTHQIRVHLAHLGHPVVGDGIYGTASTNKTQMLCAYLLKFNHPMTGQALEFKIKPSFLSESEFAQIKIEG
jgi:23S rRNA pseudouridine1911/1915/1917 synthase